MSAWETASLSLDRVVTKFLEAGGDANGAATCIGRAGTNFLRHEVFEAICGVVRWGQKGDGNVEACRELVNELSRLAEKIPKPLAHSEELDLNDDQDFCIVRELSNSKRQGRRSIVSGEALARLCKVSFRKMAAHFLFSLVDLERVDEIEGFLVEIGDEAKAVAKVVGLEWCFSLLRSGRGVPCLVDLFRAMDTRGWISADDVHCAIQFAGSSLAKMRNVAKPGAPMPNLESCRRTWQGFVKEVHLVRGIEEGLRRRLLVGLMIWDPQGCDKEVLDTLEACGSTLFHDLFRECVHCFEEDSPFSVFHPDQNEGASERKEEEDAPRQNLLVSRNKAGAAVSISIAVNFTGHFCSLTDWETTIDRLTSRFCRKEAVTNLLEHIVRIAPTNTWCTNVLVAMSKSRHSAVKDLCLYFCVAESSADLKERLLSRLSSPLQIGVTSYAALLLSGNDTHKAPRVFRTQERESDDSLPIMNHAIAAALANTSPHLTDEQIADIKAQIPDIRAILKSAYEAGANYHPHLVTDNQELWCRVYAHEDKSTQEPYTTTEATEAKDAMNTTPLPKISLEELLGKF